LEVVTLSKHGELVHTLLASTLLRTPALMRRLLMKATKLPSTVELHASGQHLSVLRLRVWLC
jgi:hypothetical protein